MVTVWDWVPVSQRRKPSYPPLQPGCVWVFGPLSAQLFVDTNTFHAWDMAKDNVDPNRLAALGVWQQHRYTITEDTW